MFEDRNAGKAPVVKVVERRKRRPNPDHVTLAWQDLFGLLEAAKGAPLRRVCKDRKSALRFRLEFYKARAALLAGPLHVRTRGEFDLPGEAAGGPWRYQQTMNTQVVFEGESTLVFRSREDASFGGELLEMLKENGVDVGVEEDQ